MSAADVAYQEYLDAYAESRAALEACGGVADVGTPEGARADELDHAADAAWDRFHYLWHAEHPGPEAVAAPEPELEAEP